MASRDQIIKKLESFVAAAESTPAVNRITNLAGRIERRQMGLDPESIIVRASAMKLRVERSPDELSFPARQLGKHRGPILSD